MKTGFGFLQAKPSTAFAPVAVTPDELGDAWQHGRVAMPLHVQWNGARFCEPNGREMNFHFGQLVAHAARTRRLSAGTIIGSGTESNVSRAAGSACIAERRVIHPAPVTLARWGSVATLTSAITPSRSPPDGGSCEPPEARRAPAGGGDS
jgi:fumarylacetoacetate (FAA) hydrolase